MSPLEVPRPQVSSKIQLWHGKMRQEPQPLPPLPRLPPQLGPFPPYRTGQGGFTSPQGTEDPVPLCRVIGRLVCVRHLWFFC